MALYKKFMTRNRSVIGCQAWYCGESKDFPKICPGFFYKPIFIFKPGKGTAIYYDIEDPDQNPVKIAEYFNSRHEELYRLSQGHKADCVRILEWIKNTTMDDIPDIFQKIVSLWGTSVVMILLARLPEVKKDVQELAFDIRSRTDSVKYTVEMRLNELVKKALPDKYFALSEFITLEEVTSGTLPAVDQLEKRSKGFVYYNEQLFSPEQGMMRMKEDGVSLLDEDHGSDLKGTTAYKGIAQGRVRIVFESSQLSAVQDGDIIVSPMTTPDFMVAMKRARAIITDEGGITCHAAIAARELKIPIVIGTRNATEILEEGELVEVDAYSGTITRMDKKRND